MMLRFFISLFLLLPLWVGWYNPFSDPLRQKTEAAKEHVEKQEYDQALEQYSSALENAPDKPELHYNIGGVRYRQNQYEDALKEYDLAAGAKDKNVAARTFYNRGNTLFSMQQHDKAIEEYIRALKINPSDEDAKFNIEFIRRVMQEQQQQQNKQDQKQDQEQDQQNPQEQNQQEQDKPEDQQKQEQQQNQQQQQQDQENQQQDQQENQEQKQQEDQMAQSKEDKEEEMTEQQAEMILQSLEQKEKDERMEKRRKLQGQMQIDRDW